MKGQELKMKMNMGSWDRLIRLILAVAVAILLLTNVLHGTLAIVLGILAAVLFLTAVFGFCPLYCPFRISTREKTSGKP
jgi:hypothetical protein